MSLVQCCIVPPLSDAHGKSNSDVRMARLKRGEIDRICVIVLLDEPDDALRYGSPQHWQVLFDTSSPSSKENTF